MSRSRLEQAERRADRGAGISAGGGITSGGGIASDAAAAITSKAKEDVAKGVTRAARNHFGAYHRVLGLSSYETEMTREAASRYSGYGRSPFWPNMDLGPLKTTPRNYERVAAAHSPSVMAKLLQHEAHMPSAGGFHDALVHSMDTARNSVPRVLTHLLGHMGTGEIVKRTPTFSHIPENQNITTEAVQRQVNRTFET